MGLQAASAALLPCTGGASADAITAAELAAKRALLALARRTDRPGAEELAELEARTDSLASCLANAAFACPVPTLFERLPAHLGENREGLLALLDLLAQQAFGDPGAIAARLGAVDTLFTVLCSGGDPVQRVAPADPVKLSPAIEALCQRAQSECRESLAEVEADFFNAANLAADLAEEGSMRELCERKAKLGRHYFAPGMLRAIVTYNLALLQSLPPGVSGWDWPETEPAQVRGPSPQEPLFESGLLREVLAAVQQRLAGAAAPPGVAQRIAALLDLEGLGPAEREALAEARLDPSRLRTAIVLVGLLLAKRELVAIELQELGVDPDRLIRDWVAELDASVKREVNQTISTCSDGDAYHRARALLELRNRLLEPSSGLRRRRPAEVHAAEAELAERRRRREALSQPSAPKPRRKAPVAPEPVRRSRVPSLSGWRVALAGAIGAGALAALAAALAPAGFFDPEIDRWGRGELSAVSEHLVAGRRNGAGQGPDFVGTLGTGWDSLSPGEREREAAALAARLRDLGISRAMLYDSERRLRVQALGDSLSVD